jgi:hypothetical protein
MLRGELKHTIGENFLDANENRFPVECWIRPILQGNMVVGSVVTMKKINEGG